MKLSSYLFFLFIAAFFIFTITNFYTSADTGTSSNNEAVTTEQQEDKGQSSFDNPFDEQEAEVTVDKGEKEKPPEQTPSESSDPSLSSSDNPFVATGDEGEIQPREVKEPPWWYPIVIWQKRMNDKLSYAMKDLKDNFSFTKLFIVFIISLIYSIGHTAGPGHGKVILGTYFLTSDVKRQKRDAAIAGAIVSMTHIGTAFILSLLLYIFLHTLSMGSQRDMAEISKRVGGTFVILTGLVLMGITLLRNKISFLNTEKSQEKFKKLSLYTIAVLSGIVPCPLAWFVLVFSLSYDIYIYGIISIIGMAIGAAITVGTTGFIVLLGKDKALGMLSESAMTSVGLWLRFAGGVILVLIGILMVIPR